MSISIHYTIVTFNSDWPRFEERPSQPIRQPWDTSSSTGRPLQTSSSTAVSSWDRSGAEYTAGLMERGTGGAGGGSGRMNHEPMRTISSESTWSSGSLDPTHIWKNMATNRLQAFLTILYPILTYINLSHPTIPYPTHKYIYIYILL